MPVIGIDWSETKTKCEKRDIMDKIASIVSREIEVPENIVNVYFNQIPLEDMRFRTVVCRISWSQAPLRNRKAKANIIYEITDYLSKSVAIDKESIGIFFSDLEGENVGVAGRPRG